MSERSGLYSSQVVTMLPDDEYASLLAELQSRRGRTKYERFAGDAKVTKIWLRLDGCILSQMPPDSFVKKIIPSSQGDLGNMFAGSGFAKTVDRFAQMNQVSREFASGLLIKIYNQHEISKSMELPDELLQGIDIVRILTTE